MIATIGQAGTPSSGDASSPHTRWSYRAGIAFLAVCGVLAVSLAERAVAPMTALVLTVATIVTATLSLLPRRSASRGLLPHWLIVLTSLVAFGWATYEIAARGAPTVLALAHFFILVVVIKLLDRDAAHDNAELLVTSLFLMVVGAIISAHVGYAVLLLAYFWVGTHVMVSFHLKCEDERIDALAAAGWEQKRRGAARGRFDAGRAAAWRLELAPRPAEGGRATPVGEVRSSDAALASASRSEVRAACAGVSSDVFAARCATSEPAPGVPYATLGVALAVGVLFFVVCPRVGTGMFGHFNSRVALAVTGFTDDVSFGGLTEIKKSDRPVMRVELLLNGESIGSPNLQPYFRGMTFDLYDGRRWHKTADPDVSLVRSGEPMIADYAPSPRDRMLEQRVRLLSPGTHYLFACYFPYALSADTERAIVVRSSDRALLMDTSRPPEPLQYSVHSLTRTTPELAGLLKRTGDPQPAPVRLLPRPSRAQPTEPLPQFRPRQPSEPLTGRRALDPARVVSRRVDDFVDKLVADQPSPADADSIREAARRIESHLTSGAYAYTLDRQDVDPRREPIEDFLFHRKRGHCEYFAAAMTVMCRLAGLNARMVNGYRGGEWNATGEYYIVREEHAHSWVEVYTGEGDWELFDPTPGSVNVTHDADSFWSVLGGVLDHLDVMWTDGIVAYDATSRENLLAQFGLWLVKLGKHGSVTAEIFYALRELLLGPEALEWGYRAIYWTLIGLIGLALYMIARMAARPLRRWYRGLARTVVHRKRRPRREGFYVRALDHLAELGYRKPGSATPLEFMNRLAGSDARLAALPEIAGAYYQVRYGDRALSLGQRGRIEQIIAGLSRASPDR